LGLYSLVHVVPKPDFQGLGGARLYVDFASR